MNKFLNLAVAAAIALTQYGAANADTIADTNVLAALLQTRANGEMAGSAGEGSEAVLPARASTRIAIRYAGSDSGNASEEQVVYAAHVG